METIVLTGIGLYFLLMILLGFFASRRDNNNGFVIGGRNVGYIPTIGSLATSFRDGTGAVFWLGIGLTAGYAGMWFIVGVLVGFSLYSFFGPSVREYAKEHDIITVGQMVRHFIGPYTEKISSFVVLAFSVLAISIQLYVAGNIFSEVLSVESWLGVISIAAVVCIYLFFGGYSTVVLTDAVQFILILTLVALPFFITPAKEDLLDFKTLFSFSKSDCIALFLIGFFYALSGSEAWQRVFSARNKQVIRTSFPLAGVFLLLMTLSLVWVGMATKGLISGDVADDQVLFQIFAQEVFSPWILSLLAIVIIAISMSTLDTFCYLFVSTFAKNFLPKEKTADRARYIKLSRVIIVLILLGTSALALTIEDVIQFLFDAASLLFITAPLYVAVGCRWCAPSKSLDIALFCSTLLSIALYVYMFTNGYFADMIMTHVPVTLNIILSSICIISHRYFLTHRK